MVPGKQNNTEQNVQCKFQARGSYLGIYFQAPSSRVQDETDEAAVVDQWEGDKVKRTFGFSLK